MRNRCVRAVLLMAAAAVPAASARADATYQPAVQGVPAMPVEVGSSDQNGNVLPVSPASPLPTKSGSYTALGCQALPSLASAAGFTSVPAGATLADIQVAGQNVNYRDDGTPPTASVGLTIYAGAPSFPYSGNLNAIQFIQTAATATGLVCFYK